MFAIDENAFKFSWRRKSELFSYFYTPKNHQRANKIEFADGRYARFEDGWLVKHMFPLYDKYGHEYNIRPYSKSRRLSAYRYFINF